jgi:RNA polymerase sigma-32 factor
MKWKHVVSCCLLQCRLLNDRERDILTKRRLSEPVVHPRRSKRPIYVFRERIRQIEVRAFEKLQLRMRELAVERGMLNAA